MGNGARDIIAAFVMSVNTFYIKSHNMDIYIIRAYNAYTKYDQYCQYYAKYCPLCGHLYGINFDHILGYFNVF